MIAMTVEQFRESTSAKPCLRHPADEHRHLRHGAMIWRTFTTSSNENQIARPLQGEDEVSFEDIRISHVVLRKRRVEVPKKSSEIYRYLRFHRSGTQIGLSTALRIGSSVC